MEMCRAQLITRVKSAAPPGDRFPIYSHAAVWKNMKNCASTSKASAKWEEREMSKFRHARCFLRVAGGADEVAQNGKLKLFIWLLHKI